MLNSSKWISSREKILFHFDEFNLKEEFRMISKELLSEVFKIPLEKIRHNETTKLFEVFKDNLFNWGSGEQGRWTNFDINKYELTYNLKEHIKSLVNNVGSGYDNQTNQYWCICNNGDIQYYSDYSESEAIEKMLEHLLKETK